jgi:hypothetical protein
VSARLSVAHGFWVAHAPRVLVSASRRNGLLSCAVWSISHALGKVRDREDAFANTRDACATQTEPASLGAQRTHWSIAT